MPFGNGSPTYQLYASYPYAGLKNGGTEKRGKSPSSKKETLESKVAVIGGERTSPVSVECPGMGKPTSTYKEWYTKVCLRTSNILDNIRPRGIIS